MITYVTSCCSVRLHDGEVYRFNGEAPTGEYPVPVRDDLTPPDLSRYRLLRPMSLSRWRTPCPRLSINRSARSEYESPVRHPPVRALDPIILQRPSKKNRS